MWEATLDDLPPQNVYPLTFTGTDAAGSPLVPIDSPDPIPLNQLRDLFQGHVGDTVHVLGAARPMHGWTLITPTESACHEDRSTGGVACTFGSEQPEQQGRVTFVPLRPATPPEDDLVYYVLLDPNNQVGTRHSGVYQLPPDGIDVLVHPQAAWFASCNAGEEEARCRESTECQACAASPEDDCPPACDLSQFDPTTVSTTLEWRLTSAITDHHSCRIFASSSA